MSLQFMLGIAALYACAGVGYFLEGKMEWGLICVCWAVGNALLGMVSQ